MKLGQPWSVAELECAVEMARSGVGPEAIGATLGRTRMAVEQRFKEMRRQGVVIPRRQQRLSNDESATLRNRVKKTGQTPIEVLILKGDQAEAREKREIGWSIERLCDWFGYDASLIAAWVYDIKAPAPRMRRCVTCQCDISNERNGYRMCVLHRREAEAIAGVFACA